MTSTSEISGNASSGILRNDQIPASTSKSVPVKTRNRFRAHQSIHRAITLHSSRRVHAQLLARNRLPIFLGYDRGLPRSTASKLAGTFVDPFSFLAESNRRPHCRHSHLWHRGHKERYRDFRARNRGATRVREFYAEDVAALVWWTRLGCQFCVRLRSIHCRCCSCSRWRRNERSESGLKLALRIHEKVCGRNDVFSHIQPFPYDEIVSHTGAQFHLARFEVRVASLYERNLAVAGLQYAARGNH